MRLVGVLVVLGACGAPKATGPAWPAPSTTAEDGGESIEPRTTSVAASIEKSPDAPPAQDAKPSEDTMPAAPAADDDDNPATPSTESTSVDDDVLMTDDMIIEIEDDE